jgi:hypothetical protein
MTTAKVPVPDITRLDARAKGEGKSRSVMLVIAIRSFLRADTASKRAAKSEIENVQLRRDLRSLLEQRDALIIENQALKDVVRGLRNRLGAYTRRIKARFPRAAWNRVFGDDDIEV